VSRVLLLVLLALILSGCRDEPPDRRGEAMEALIAFARAPSDETWAAVPLAAHVDLGLGDTRRARRSRQALRDPGAWRLSLNFFRAGVGRLSGLELIARRNRTLRITFGPHPHCVAPRRIPPPPQAAGLERVVVQPREWDSCLAWWTVDAFLNAEGEIEAVTLDLWEP
jgi:hypothetical protein